MGLVVSFLCRCTAAHSSARKTDLDSSNLRTGVRLIFPTRKKRALLDLIVSTKAGSANRG